MLTTIQARAAVRKHASKLNTSVDRLWTDGIEGYNRATGDKRIVTVALGSMWNAPVPNTTETIVKSINAELGAGVARVTPGGYVKINAVMES